MFECFIEFDQFTSSEFEYMLLRLVFCSHLVVEVWRARLLDVTAEDVRHKLSICKADESVRARDEGWEIANVQTTWIKAVSCQQYSRLAIVISQAQNVMARDRDNIDNAITEVNTPNILWPVHNIEKFAGAFAVSGIIVVFARAAN